MIVPIEGPYSSRLEDIAAYQKQRHVASAKVAASIVIPGKPILEGLLESRIAWKDQSFCQETCKSFRRRLHQKVDGTSWAVIHVREHSLYSNALRWPLLETVKMLLCWAIS